MSEKGNIDPADETFYYAENGKVVNDGRSFELPKGPLIQSAIDAASAMGPTTRASGNDSARVKEGQGGIYNQTVELADFVLFDGPQTTIMSGNPATITAANNTSFNCQAVANTADGGIALDINASLSFQYNIESMAVSGNGGIAVSLSGVSDNIVGVCTELTLSGNNCIGIDITSTNPTPSDLNYDAVSMDGDDCTFVRVNQSSVFDVTTVEVSSIGQVGTGGKAIHLLSTNLGSIVLSSPIINGDVLIEGGGIVLDATVVNQAVTIKSGAVATFKSIGVQFGSLTIEAGGELNVICVNCPGLLTIDPAATVNGNINGQDYGSYIDVPADDEVLSAFSMSDQNPTTTDDPLQIEFGAAQGSGSNPVQLSVAGAITINEDRQYKFRLTLQYGRVAAGGVSLLFVRALINGTQSGNSLETRLDNTNVNNPTQVSFSRDLVATDVVTFEIVRDSTGNDSGGLFTGSPTLSWNDAPSASIVISRGILVKP